MYKLICRSVESAIVNTRPLIVGKYLELHDHGNIWKVNLIFRITINYNTASISFNSMYKTILFILLRFFNECHIFTIDKAYNWY